MSKFYKTTSRRFFFCFFQFVSFHRNFNRLALWAASCLSIRQEVLSPPPVHAFHVLSRIDCFSTPSRSSPTAHHNMLTKRARAFWDGTLTTTNNKLRLPPEPEPTNYRQLRRRHHSSYTTEPQWVLPVKKHRHTHTHRSPHRR